jgi:hypothetical protein
MARKRRALKGLDYQSPEYWEKLLREDGLSMEAGTSRRLTYVGSSKTLESIEAEVVTGVESKKWNKQVSHQKVN